MRKRFYSLVIDPAMIDRMKQAAAEQGVTVSEFIRRAVRAALEARQKQGQAAQGRREQIF